MLFEPINPIKSHDMILSDTVDSEIEAYMLSMLLSTKTEDEINKYLSYGASILEIFQYSFTTKHICELSYEMQCAVYDISPCAYEYHTSFRIEGLWV